MVYFVPVFSDVDICYISYRTYILDREILFVKGIFKPILTAWALRGFFRGSKVTQALLLRNCQHGGCILQNGQITLTEVNGQGTY